MPGTPRHKPENPRKPRPTPRPQTPSRVIHAHDEHPSRAMLLSDTTRSKTKICPAPQARQRLDQGRREGPRKCPDAQARAHRPSPRRSTHPGPNASRAAPSPARTERRRRRTATPAWGTTRAAEHATVGRAARRFVVHRTNALRRKCAATVQARRGPACGAQAPKACQGSSGSDSPVPAMPCSLPVSARPMSVVTAATSAS